jgi:uncharacterized glyoxalase superfamily protein PhnB
MPYLVVENAESLAEFAREVFDAEVVERLTLEDGTVNHVEVSIGDSIVMMGRARRPEEVMPAMLYVYVKDCDDVYRKALAHGATSLMEPSDQFYGDRNAGVRDPWGVTWWLGTHVEDVSSEDMQRRNREQHSGNGGG